MIVEARTDPAPQMGLLRALADAGVWHCYAGVDDLHLGLTSSIRPRQRVLEATSRDRDPRNPDGEALLRKALSVQNFESRGLNAPLKSGLMRWERPIDYFKSID